MCHLILAAPLLTLPLFLIWPWPAAAAVNVPVLVLSGVVYVLVMRVMHTPRRVGPEALIGAQGEVLDARDGHLQVRVQGERWTASGRTDLRPGERVEVIGRQGMRLEVRRPRASLTPARPR